MPIVLNIDKQELNLSFTNLFNTCIMMVEITTGHYFVQYKGLSLEIPIQFSSAPMPKLKKRYPENFIYIRNIIFDIVPKLKIPLFYFITSLL